MEEREKGDNQLSYHERSIFQDSCRQGVDSTCVHPTLQAQTDDIIIAHQWVMTDVDLMEHHRLLSDAPISCACVCVCVCVSVYVYVCVYACVSVCVHPHMCYTPFQLAVLTIGEQHSLPGS